MISIIDCGNFKLQFGDDNIIIIVSNGYSAKIKGILTIRKNIDGIYFLYRWYDEGHFMDCFDTVETTSGRYRLKVVGVDEV